MIFRILKTRSSVAPTLDYNYDKVADGTARIVAGHRLPRLSRAGIYASFAALEHTGYPIKEVGFHMSVNPGPDDTCTESQIFDAICKVMYRLGYKDQPFLVFRHNDIDRTHYHVVSSRISTVTGRKINNYYENRKLTDYARKIGPELGFTVPDGSAEKAVNKYTLGDRPIPGRFVPGKSVYRQLKGIYAHALQYCYSDFSDLAAVLERKGVRATIGGTSNAPKVILQGLDAAGNPVTAPVSEAMARRTWYESYEGMKFYHSHNDYPRALDLKYHVEMAFRESKSTEGLMKYLKWLGIEPVVTGNNVKFIDHKAMAVIDASALPSYVRDRILNASAKVQTHITFPAIARVLYPVGQPQGASWSGKVAPTKEQLRQKWDEERSGAMDANFEDTRYVEKLK